MSHGGRNEPGTAVGLVARLRRKLPPFGRPGGDLNPGMEPDPLEDPGNVVFSGALGVKVLLGYLAVRQPRPTSRATSRSRAVSLSLGSSARGCGCGQRLVLSSTAAICWCGANHRALIRKELAA